MVEYMQVKIV